MIVIATHSHADFDGLASMVAAGKLFPDAMLVFPGGAEGAVRRFAAAHDIGVAALKDVDLSLVTQLVIVDTHDPERVGALRSCWADPRVRVLIYDHHGDATEPSTGADGSARVVQVVEPVGATTTILVEQIRTRRIQPTPFEATVLALGLYEETGFFAFASTTARDLAAGSFLLEAGADLNLVAETLRRPLDPDAVALLNDLLEHSEVHYLEGQKVLVATSALDKCRGEAAGVVHMLADVEGVDAVLVAVAMEEKVEVIGRSRKPEIDVGWIAREFGGGGHAVAAAASVKGQTLAEVKERLVRLLTTQYRPTLLAKDVMTAPVKTVGEDASVGEAGERMTTYGVNVLPVLDARSRYVGLVGRESIQKALFHRLDKATVKEIMQQDAFAALPATPFHEIETAMIERNQRFVPVLDGRSVVGVITRTDLLRTLHDDVLRAARVHGKEREPAGEGSAMRRRNVAGHLRSRLPAPVFALLREAGQLADRLTVPLYVVGGFVRDLLLGIENLDVDFVVEGDGLAFARALAKERSGRVTVHERFGTAVVVLPSGLKVDVATARTEYYEYPTALPTVEHGSIKKDLYRRDFTVNALAIRLNGNRFGDVLDFYGGQRDLKDKSLRVLHSLSFIEDPTRVFRAIRFERRYGFHLSKGTSALVRGAVAMKLFHRLSGHRLLEELRALLSEQNPKETAARMAELDLLRFIHPGLVWSSRMAQRLRSVEEVLDWYRLLYLNRPVQGWLVYLSALLGGLSNRAAGEVMRRLPFTEKEAVVLKAVRTSSGRVLRQLGKRPTPAPSAVCAALEGLPEEAILNVMSAGTSEEMKRLVSKYLTTWREIRPVLTGDDLKAMGLKPGPLFGKILRKILDARVNGEVRTKPEEQELARRLVARLE